MFNFFNVLQFLIQLIGEVHAVESALPGAPGATKSQAVLDKVTPIASVIGAEVPHIQSLIDGAVGIFKSVGVFKSAPAAAATSSTAAPAGDGSQSAN
jgi:hypothetical protein